MTHIAISDEIASTLAAAAASTGCTQDELASILIEQGLHRDEDFALTPEQQTRILHSLAQAERGELIDGETVMAKFDKVLEEIQAR